MDQARLVIAIVLSVLVFLVWQLFFVDQQTVQKPAQKPQQSPAKAVPLQPEQPYPGETEKAKVSQPDIADATVTTPGRIAQTITVDTPLYQVKLSEKGAGLTSFILKQYREAVQKDSPLKELLPQDKPLETVLTEFDGKSLGDLDRAVFSNNVNTDTVRIEKSSNAITFSWKSDKGVVVEKVYTFNPDSYLIGLDIVIKNGSQQSIQQNWLACWPLSFGHF